MTDPREDILPQTRLPSIPRLCLKVPEAARALGCCPRTVWNLIRSEGLPTVRYGKATAIPVAGLRRWLRERTVVEQEGQRP